MSALAQKILELDRAYPADEDDRQGEQEFSMLGIDWAELVALATAEIPAVAKPYGVAILACSKSKLARPAPAEQLYTGALFKASRIVAKKLAKRFVILSAKHGVVEPGLVLEPYDLSLAEHPNPKWLGAAVFSRALVDDLRGVDPARVLLLAPQSYVEHVSVAGMSQWAQPLKGLGIGQQKAKLKQLAEGV